jgi:hypothetical protein
MYVAFLRRYIGETARNRGSPKVGAALTQAFANTGRWTGVLTWGWPRPGVTTTPRPTPVRFVCVPTSDCPALNQPPCNRAARDEPDPPGSKAAALAPAIVPGVAVRARFRIGPRPFFGRLAYNFGRWRKLLEQHSR